MSEKDDPLEGIVDINRVRRRQIERRIADVDSSYLDPTERAELVHTLLHVVIPSDNDKHVFAGETWWDLLCFACSFIGHAAVGLDDDDFMWLARALNQWLHNAHYSSTNILKQSRTGRLSYWTEIIEQYTTTEEEQDDVEDEPGD